MRDHEPVLKEERQGRAFVHLFRHSDCIQALQDHNLWSSDIPEFEELLLGDAAILIQDDPPDHTKYRIAVTPWVNQMTANASKLMKTGFDPLRDELNKDSIDAVALAEQITTEVLTLFFGFRHNELECLKSWSSRFGDGVGIEFLEFEGENVETQINFVREMHVELDDFLDSLITNPPEPIGCLINSLESSLGDQLLSRALLKSLIFASGHTLSGQIANSLEVLATQGKEKQELLSVNSGSQSRQIAEECIRIRPVFRGSHRVAKRDSEVRGIKVFAGDYLIVWNASANLDRRAFNKPETIEPAGRKLRHTSFGSGIHRCIGATLGSQVITAIVSQVLRAQRTLSVKSSTPAKDPWVDSFEALEIAVY
ncbi:MAG: cytochrome P450 [Pseudomonadota bacterium]